MNTPIISMSNFFKNHISLKGWLFIVLFLIGSIGYYLEFFGVLTAIVLALFITAMVVSMFLVGYLILGKNTSFPFRAYVLYIVLFSVVRYAYIYFYLSNHLPSYTVFHYPVRALPITILGTAAVIFLGYSYAIYEWGLAAREKYSKKLKTNNEQFNQPIKIRSSGKWVYLLPQDILYIKANGEYVNYYTDTNVYSCYQRLKAAEIELKKFGFLKTHRSYVVNPIFVESIGNSEIMLKGEKTLPLSKKYKHAVKTKIELIRKRK